MPDRALLNRKQWLAGQTIEHKHKPHLSHLRHGRNFAPFPAHSYQIRRRRHVIIPQIVVNHLVVPKQLAGCRVQRHQRVSKQILTFPVRAVKIVGRRPEGQEYHSALDIHTHDGPHISTGSIFPPLSFPRVVADLAWLGDGVKAPHELSCLHVEGANCSAGSFRGNLLKPRT